MPRITTPVDRILRVRCVQSGCKGHYDYTGPKSASFAVVEAEAFGWERHNATGQLRCPDHVGQLWIISAELGV